MEIEVDYNPSPNNKYFISVLTGDCEAISMDYTLKGSRIIKQVLIDKKLFPECRMPDSEWDAIVLNNGLFARKYHVRWIDMGRLDWVNDEIWETVWSKPVSLDVKCRLLDYSHLVCDNYMALDMFSKELKEFEYFLACQIAKYGK